MLNIFCNFMTGSLLFWTFQQIIMQVNIAGEVLPFNVIRTLPSTLDLLEIWISMLLI